MENMSESAEGLGGEISSPQKIDEETSYNLACERFIQWLQDNGASFPKIQWPSKNTVEGVRGAVALEDIQAGEHMVAVPAALLLGPPRFAGPGADPGSPLPAVVAAHPEFLRTDVGLSLYVMQEMIKGEESFFAPFLNILPDPLNATDWAPEELEQLQDSKFVGRLRFRAQHLRGTYRRTFGALFEEFPAAFSPETHTWPRFKKAWGTIQARAFGRRLPWTALVPFADCLNHSNVATKYDYDVDGNGLFRLFPSNSNNYPAGSEVFNSYGRRTNENLLMEYGFALPKNEWDSVHIPIKLELDDPNYAAKRSLLLRFGTPSSRTFHIETSQFSFEALMFCRLVCLSDTELQNLPSALKREDVYHFIASWTNELAALNLLRESILKINKEFSTTIDEDQEILEKTPPDDERMVFALHFRITKKRILHFHLQLLEVMQKMVERAAQQSIWSCNEQPSGNTNAEKTPEDGLVLDEIPHLEQHLKQLYLGKQNTHTAAASFCDDLAVPPELTAVAEQICNDYCSDVSKFFITLNENVLADTASSNSNTGVDTVVLTTDQICLTLPEREKEAVLTEFGDEDESCSGGHDVKKGQKENNGACASSSSVISS